MTDDDLLAWGLICAVAIGIGLILVRRPLLRGSNLLVVYWLLMMIVGPWVAIWSTGWFLTEPELITRALLMYLVALVGFAVAFLTARLGTSADILSIEVGTARLRNGYGLPFAVVAVAGAGLCWTWYVTGGIPLLKSDKYFVSSSSVYVTLRPIYTLSLHMLSTVATFVLAIGIGRRKSIGYWLCLLLALTLLLLTGKRGQLLAPILYAGLVMSLMAGSVRRLVAAMLVIVIVASIVGAIAGNDLLVGMQRTAVHSFFVGVRELTVLLNAFPGDYVMGGTYVAGLLSFVPTEYLPLKQELLFGRYIRILLGHDPDFAGGLRGVIRGRGLRQLRVDRNTGCQLPVRTGGLHQ